MGKLEDFKDKCWICGRNANELKEIEYIIRKSSKGGISDLKEEEEEKMLNFELLHSNMNLIYENADPNGIYKYGEVCAIFNICDICYAFILDIADDKFRENLEKMLNK